MKVLYKPRLSAGIVFAVFFSLVLTGKPISAAEIFQDGFENGFAGWTKTELQNGTGQIDNGTARFEVPDGTRGGNAHVVQNISWPAGRKLWYSCDIKVSDKNSTEAVVGGIYLLEATVTTGSWRDRGNIEITDSNAASGFEPGQVLNDSTFILRMAYRGRDGGRDGHRQGEMIQAPARNVWHRVQMLVDLSGSNPRYAWWLNGRFIWQDIDSSSGGDTAAPTEFHAGLTNVDWASGNRGLVWIDNCSVSDTGPDPGSSSPLSPQPTNPPSPTETSGAGGQPTATIRPPTLTSQPDLPSPTETSGEGGQPTATNRPAGPTPTIALGNGDADGNGADNFADLIAIMRNFLNNVTNSLDQYKDGKINSFDFAVVAGKLPIQPTTNPSTTLGASPQPTSPAKASATAGPATPYPTYPPGIISAEWTQFAHDAQRTGYSVDNVPTPWRLAWLWNVNAGGNLGVPDLVQPITGGGRVYLVAGNSVFALDQSSGTVIWSRGNIGELSGTPAFAGGYLYVPSGNGSVYKLDAGTGAVVSSFSGGGPFTQAALLVENTVYAVSESGGLYALNTDNMTKRWEYQAGDSAVTPAAYSTREGGVVIFGTKNLYVFAVNANDGSLKWKVKPTGRSYEPCCRLSRNGAFMENGWPVVADQHSVVFIRISLDWDAIWQGPITIPKQGGGIFPGTNEEIVSFLSSRPGEQNLFALNISDGSTAFIPAVGEATASDGGTSGQPHPPILKANGSQETAYLYWRNFNTCVNMGWCDGRYDSTLGEMVLDGTTISGLSRPGYIRSVDFPFIPGDEIGYITVAGNSIFHNHYTATHSVTNLNGASTSSAPTFIWGQLDNGTCLNNSSHYCSNGLQSFTALDDTNRNYGQGFYEYYSDWCSLHGGCNGTISMTVVSNDLILMKMGDGGLMAFRSGNPEAYAPLFADSLGSSKVLGSALSDEDVSSQEAWRYLGRTITVTGQITQVIDHLPKAYYLYFSGSGKEKLLARIFAADLAKFPFDPRVLAGKILKITGQITLEGPDGKQTEIFLSRPEQISWEKDGRN